MLMCGIAGIISKNDISYMEDILKSFQTSLHHRGPDSKGMHIDLKQGFAHTRLAIVDKETGQQPMYNSDSKDIGIVYNGEIYNYIELRKQLIDKGYIFKTKSDTEVIIKLYEEYGEEAFSKLNGMFAFCIWDNRTNTTYLVRDMCGIKPLYIYEDINYLIFSSEIKTILNMKQLDLSLDAKGIQDYFIFRYIHAPHTLFKKIKRLRAGTFIKYKKGNCFHCTYKDFNYNISIPQKDIEEELIEILDTVIQSQLMGEVPIGVLLSGGIDSSAISYFIHKNNANLTTFNIGYPEVNEFQYSREVAKKFNLKHIEVVTTIDELIQNFDTVVSALDEPLADPACFPLYILCNELKKHVTVVLSGEGGDELFAGYPQYAAVNNSNTSDSFNLFLEKSYYFLNYKDFFVNPDLYEMYRHEHYFNMPSNVVNAMSYYDMKTWVPEDLMMKADKILMAHSLEGRFPFLDDRIINFANKLPSNLKLNGNTTKYILKNAMKKYLPETIVNRSKMGFTVPVTEILERMKPTVMEIFNNATMFDDILNIDVIKNVPINYYNNKPGRYSGLQVWTIFIFLYWFNVMMGGT